MPARGEQLALPIHGRFQEPAPPPGCQRWTSRQHCWVPRSAGGFDRSRYLVRPLDEATAKDYVCQNHYSGAFPAALRRFGLYYLEEDAVPALVGVAVYGAPVQARVLTNVLPELQPYRQSMELSRFVLEGDPLVPSAPGGRAPGNAETWFLSQTLRRLAGEGVQAVVAFSDPVARVVDGRTLWPGHHGTIYTAGAAVYTGRATARIVTLLRDGTTISDRALSKVRRQEAGHEYVERRLIAQGAPPRLKGDPARWLAEALNDAGALRMRHAGCHRFVLHTSPRARRTVRIAATALPHPTSLRPR